MFLGLVALLALVVVASIVLAIVLVVKNRRRRRDDMARAGEYGAADPNAAARQAEGGQNAWMRTTF